MTTPRSVYGSVDNHARLQHRARHRFARIRVCGKRARCSPSGRQVSPRQQSRHPSPARGRPRRTDRPCPGARAAGSGPDAHHGRHRPRRLEPGAHRACASRWERTLAQDRPQASALSAGVRAGIGAGLLGLVLAAGLRLRLPHRRAAALRLRVRHAALVVAARRLHARLRAVPGDLQHQPVPLVQAGLVLPAVPDDCRRLRRQGADAMGQGGAARAHLQSVVVSAGACSRWS